MEERDKAMIMDGQIDDGLKNKQTDRECREGRVTHKSISLLYNDSKNQYI